MLLFKLLRKFYFTKIKKFKIRTVIIRGKLSDKQKTLIAEYKGKYFFESYKGEKFDILEIGFGNGHHIAAFAEKNKDKKVFGVEMYPQGIYHTLEKIIFKKIENVKLFRMDGRTFLNKVKPKSLDKIFVLFPDPWPKKKDFKRRIVNLEFINTCLGKISPSGELIVATDWETYKDEILSVLEQNFDKQAYFLESLDNKNLKNQEFGKYEDIIKGTFPQRAIKEGRNIHIFTIKKL